MLKIPLSWLKTEAANVQVKEVAGDASHTAVADGQTRPLRAGALLAGGDMISTEIMAVWFSNT